MLRKIGISLLAICMMLAVFVSSLTNNTKAEDNHKTKVNIHKILLEKSELDSFTQGTSGLDGTKYNGTQIENIQSYFGNSAKAIDGVAFRVFKVYENGNDGAKLGSDASMPADLNKGDFATKYYKEVTTDDNAQASPFLTKNGGIADVVLADGKYVVIEDKVASPYYSSEGKELTDSKAIPFELELPITKPDGSGLFDLNTPLHVYPKNTEDKPTVDKKFEDIDDMNRDVEIGKEIPYKVTTTIPKNAAYKTIKWTDTMVQGLDFIQDSIVVEDNQNIGLANNTDYVVTQTVRGFILNLTESGLAKVEEKAKLGEVQITLKYKGILNDSAIVETDIPNEVKFDYGNRPGIDSTPKPGKPNENGEIIVDKTWEGNQPAGTTIKFKVYEKETGKLVGEITLGENGNKLSGLDKNKDYIAIEDSVDGYEPEYKDPAAGVFGVVNKKNPNPNPLKPTPPNVKTYGKRFIKTNDKAVDSADLKKLAGAEFIVKNAQGQFLRLKDTAEQANNITVYNSAEAAYQEAVKNKSAEIAAKKAVRDAAYETLNMQWTWTTVESEAFKFISNEEGKFEVKGLVPGNYNLVETKAPEGFALLPSPISFNVAMGSWTDTSGIDGHAQVKNKDITIPQTGGMGTVIFTVVGLSLMSAAVIAMRRRNKEEQ